jgi:hypothetical protein
MAVASRLGASVGARLGVSVGFNDGCSELYALAPVGARVGASVGKLMVGDSVLARVGPLVTKRNEALSIDMPASDVSVAPRICVNTSTAAVVGIVASTITLPASTLSSMSDDETLPALARAAETAAICMRPNVDTEPVSTRRSVVLSALGALVFCIVCRQRAAAATAGADDALVSEAADAAVPPPARVVP